MKFKAYIRHHRLKGVPDGWYLVCIRTTRQEAHDEAVRIIQEWNKDQNPKVTYEIYVAEVTE